LNFTFYILHLKSSIFITLILASATSAGAQDVLLEKVQRGDKVVLFAENNSETAQLVTLDMTLENVVTDKKLPLEVVLSAGERKEIIILSPIPLKAWSYRTKFSHQDYSPDARADNLPNSDSYISDNPSGISNKANRSDSKAKMDEVAGETDYFMLPPENTDDAPMPARYARTMLQGDHHTPVAKSHLPEAELLFFGQTGCPRCAMTRDYLGKHGIPYKELNVTDNDANQQLMNKYLFDSGFTGGKFMMPVIIVDEVAHYSIADLDGFLSGLSADR